MNSVSKQSMYQHSSIKQIAQDSFVASEPKYFTEGAIG